MSEGLITFWPLLAFTFTIIGLPILVIFKWDELFLGLKLYKPLHKLTRRHYIKFGFGYHWVTARVKETYDGKIYANYCDYIFYLNKDGTMERFGGRWFTLSFERELEEYTPLTWKLEERPKQDSNVVQLNN